MALLRPMAGSVVKAGFDWPGAAEPPLYHQNYRGIPLAAYKFSFPGHDGHSARYHGAIDFGGVPAGTPIVAAERGKIVQFGKSYPDGALYVKLQIRPGTIVEVWHLSRFRSLFVGKIVARGAVIGYNGSTGWADGPHCHCVLKITERDPDGATRQYLYNPLRFMVGGDLAGDARVKPYY